MDARGLDFCKYTVSDLETSIPFYRDALGLALEKHVEEVGWAEFAVPPSTLALEEVDPAGRASPDGGAAAIALAVEDVETAVDDLQDRGVSVLREPLDTGVCDKATIADPDGNPIVLHHRHNGTYGRQNPFP